MPHAHDAEFHRLAEAVLKRLRRIPAGLSGDDSPFTDFWLEYAAQVQGEHSFAFGEYERLVRVECDGCVERLSEAEVELLWPGTAAFSDWMEEGPPILTEQRENVSDELFRHIQSRAADLDLPT